MLIPVKTRDFSEAHQLLIVLYIITIYLSASFTGKDKTLYNNILKDEIVGFFLQCSQTSTVVKISEQVKLELKLDRNNDVWLEHPHADTMVPSAGHLAEQLKMKQYAQFLLPVRCI